MTALEARDEDTRSYVDIAESLEERSSAVTKDLAQLWRRVAFSILISNTDDHLRNRDLLAVAPLFRLDRTDALRILDDVQSAVSRWPHVATAHGLSKAEQAAMAPAFEHAQAQMAAGLLGR